MIDARNYRVVETLRNGVQLCIRSARPDDTDRLVEAFHELDPASVYLRFFCPKKELSAAELQRFREIDFRTRVVLFGTVQRDEREIIIASGTYIRSDEDAAEVAFVVEEDYHGLGIARRLLKHLANVAVDAGVRRFTAEVLPHNAAMLSVFERCGWPVRTRADHGVIQIELALDKTGPG
jgi:RimJ/RimL family protein N-acetyltransferase